MSSNILHLNVVDPALASPPPQPRLAPRTFLLSLLVFTIICSSRCLAVPFQQPSSAASRTPNTDFITAASIPAIASTISSTHTPPTTATKAAAASPTIVIGFLGGHVKKNNAIHSEVQVAMHLRQQYPVGVYAEVFANSHGQVAFQQIQRLLDINHDGVLSLAEKQHARIILYGHSWGASETVAMAHQLQQAGIPVLLAVLVDRVPRFGEGDESIPANVAQAINFYQLNGLLHGNRTILAADPASTQILGNFQFNYKDNHVACDQYPWYARLFMGPHIEIENDPRVWNQVESLIRTKLPPEKTPATLALISHSH